jgi:hypothetical protein
MKRFVVGCAVAFGLSAAASAEVIYDSNGFEDFTVGALDGQMGFVGDTAGSGVAPQVVDGSTDQFLGTKSLRLEVPNVIGSQSVVDLPMADYKGVYETVTVSFNVFRQDDGWNSNLWYWLRGDNATYGLQWDSGGALPLGFGPAAIPLVLDAWEPMTITWNLETGEAEGTYDGVTHTLNQGVNEAAGFFMYLGRENGDETRGGEVLWLDDFVITGTLIPEPASLVLLALGGLALRRR